MSKTFFAETRDVHECPGCEEQCFMTVFVRSRDGQTPVAARIYCDKNESYGPTKVELDDIRPMLRGLKFQEMT